MHRGLDMVKSYNEHWIGFGSKWLALSSHCSDRTIMMHVLRLSALIILSVHSYQSFLPG
jgi:hypothetical protein